MNLENMFKKKAVRTRMERSQAESRPEKRPSGKR